MAMIKIKSSVTGKTSLVSESAYNSFFKDTSLYTIIKENEPIIEKTQEVKITNETKPEKEQTIKPIKPLKAKADSKDISEEI